MTATQTLRRISMVSPPHDPPPQPAEAHAAAGFLVHAAALAAVLSEAGFDAQSLAAKAQDPAIKQAVIDNTEKAVERGTFGIPTFFIGTEIFFGKERLGQIEEMLENS